MANILMTPAEICQQIRAVFPDAEIKGGVTPSGFELQCKLTTNTRSFCVTKGLDARDFGQALQALFNRITYYQTAQQPLSDVQLDPQKYCVMHPLLGWKEFQREMFRRNGISCESLLENYLSSGDTSLIQQLIQVGLAPSQIAQSHSEEDLKIFKALFDRLQQTTSDANAPIFSRFKTDYPVVFSALLKGIKQAFIRPAGETPYQAILSNLTKRVIGQEGAAQLVAAALTSQASRNSNKKFLFVGATGIGKTEMAKAIATQKENRFVMLAMNQYQEEHTMSNLFGAPPGYVGSGDRPHFVKMLDRFSPVQKRYEGSTAVYEVNNLVLLFDELEKAHSKLKQSLLTLFDEGYVVVQYCSEGGYGENTSKKYEFINCLFIGTSNLYSQEITAFFQTGADLQAIADAFIQLNATVPVPTRFSPEFLGRLKVIPFGPIPRGESYQAVLRSKIKEQLPQLKKELSCLDVQIENEAQVLTILEDLLYGEGVDLRRIKNFFEINVVGAIYKQIMTQAHIDLTKVSIVIAPYQNRLIGIKAQTLFLGTSVDLTELFPV